MIRALPFVRLFTAALCCAELRAAALTTVSGSANADALVRTLTPPFTQFRSEQQDLVPVVIPNGMTGGVSLSIFSGVSGARIFAEATYGVLRASAYVWGIEPVGNESNSAYGTALASWEDRIQVCAPGACDLLEFGLLISHRFELLGDQSFGSVEISVPGDQRTYYQQNGSGPSGNPSVRNGSITFRVPVQANGSVQLRVRLITVAQLLGQSSYRSADVDYAHTLAWAGDPVAYLGGVPLSGITLTSESGFNYMSPANVPEPSTFLLASVGLWLAADRRKRAKRGLAALLLASGGAFAAAVIPTPQVSIFAVSNNGQGLVGPTINENQIGPGAFLSNFSSAPLIPTAPGYAYGSGEASYGTLRAYASAANAIGFQATATGSASWADSVTLSRPDWDGLVGLAYASFYVSGEYLVSTASPLSLANVNMGVSLDTFTTSGVTVSNYYSNFVARSNGFNDGTSIFRLHTVEIPFTWGTPFVFQLSLGVGAASSDFAGAGLGVARGDLSHTLLWQGLSVLDPVTGGSAAGFSAPSSSGTNWLAPVPEPSTIVVGLGLLIIALRRVRTA